MRRSVCACNQATCISEDAADVLSCLCVCQDSTHPMINIRNVGALSDTEKSVFKRKIYPGSFEE